MKDKHPLSSFSGEFLDSAEEAEYRHAHLLASRHHIRRLILVASLVFAAFLASDFGLDGWGEVLAIKAALRMLVLAAGIAAFVALAPGTPAAIEGWTFAWMAVAAASATAIYTLSPGVDDITHVSAIFIVLLGYLAFPVRFSIKTPLMVAATVAFAVALSPRPGEPHHYGEFLGLLAAASIFGLLGAAESNRLRRLQHAAMLAERAARTSLDESRDTLRRLFSAAPVSLTITRIDNGALLELNEAARRMAGFEDLDLPTSVKDFYVEPRDRERLIAAVRESGTVEGFETKLQFPNGRVLDVLMGACLISYQGTECLMTGVTDITDRKRLEDELRRMAVTDQLTGLYNRHYFFDAARRETERARRHGRPVGVMMMDLDRFKLVNDTHGHDVGDVVLRAFAERCRETLRESDIMARLGGEEFAVLLPETNLAGTAALAWRIRAAVAGEGIRREGVEVHLTVSIGVTELAGDDTSIDQTLARADRALLRAKRTGRDRVVVAAAEEEAADE